MDTKSIQRRDKLKAMIDERFQGVVSDRAYNRLKDVVGNGREQPFQAPGQWLEFSPAEEQERRKYLGQIRSTIRKKHKNFEFQHRHVVAILMVPAEELSAVGTLAYEKDPEILLRTLQDIYCFQRHFLQKKASQEEKSDDVQQEDGQTGNASKTRKSRNQREKEECKRYDRNQCIVTGAAHPHVCHIVPFSFNSSEANALKTKTYIDAIGSMFGRVFQDDWKNKLADPRPHGRGASDKHWNMLCLSPQLHNWWGRGYFAFEHMWDEQHGQDAKIALRFHWMPKTTFNSHGEEPSIVHCAQIQNAVRDHHATQTKHPTTSEFPRDGEKYPGVVQAFLRTGERLATGQIFIISRPAKFVPHFKAMIDLQFAAIKMLALTGGAGDSKLLGLDDDDDTVAGASVSGFDASVQSPSIAPSHVDSIGELGAQFEGLKT
ncbi:hypothetical protein F52700_2715 [Fusarium sp. NRRL 52700]|nr:hypothetical protein F52700_2715 [Fusarium sp. NRRL 52700]